MSAQVARVDPEATLFEVARKLAAVEVGALVVGGVDRIDGIISERDVVIAIAERNHPDAILAGEVAVRDNLLWIGPEHSVGEAANLMIERGVRHALVGVDGNLAGIVSARDLLAALSTISPR